MNQLDAPRLPDGPDPDAVRWTWRDLDRCEHGRHSIDSCGDCPGGQSRGNRFLLSADWRERFRYREGRAEVRIGTMVHGEPIWVVVRDRPREAAVTEDEADGKLPCTNCGHRVRPGRHSVAECARFQNEDQAAEGVACRTEGCVQIAHDEAEPHIDIDGQEFRNG